MSYPFFVVIRHILEVHIMKNFSISKLAETIIAQLEASEAISMDEYKRLAAEADALLKACREELSQTV